MGIYRFHLIGAHPVEIEVAATTISDLNKIISGQRFVEGRATIPDDYGVLAGILIATARIQCVMEIT